MPFTAADLTPVLALWMVVHDTGHYTYSLPDYAAQTGLDPRQFADVGEGSGWIDGRVTIEITEIGPVLTVDIGAVDGVDEAHRSFVVVLRELADDEVPAPGPALR